MSKTGGGLSKESDLSDWEMKVLEVIGVEAVEGIDGGYDVGLNEDVELNGKVNEEMVDYTEYTDVRVEQDRSYVDVSSVKERMKVEKKAVKLGGQERIIEIEERRLEIEEEMLRIKRRRLEIEEERLKMEMRRNEL